MPFAIPHESLTRGWLPAEHVGGEEAITHETVTEALAA
jgi:hypothetical protein